MPSPQPSIPSPQPPARPLIVDTNIVLDMLVFNDTDAAALRQQLDQPPPSTPSTLSAAPGSTAPGWRWLATTAMHDELAHVLTYPHLQPRLQRAQLSAQMVLARYQSRIELVPTAAPAPVRCKDGDDQKFIDLAIAHQAVLFSKDKAVLKLRKRLARLGVWVGPIAQWPLHEAPQAQQAR